METINPNVLDEADDEDECLDASATAKND